MPESQNIEHKYSWHDNYLKWICGFSNAESGKILSQEKCKNNLHNSQ